MDAPLPELADELAELRRRAYGPDADIAHDTAAQQRLRALEASRRPIVRAAPALPDSALTRTPVTTAPSAELADPPPTPAAPSPATAQPGPADPIAEESEAPRSISLQPWWRRHARWVIGSVAVLLIAATASVASNLAAPLADATLAPVRTTANDRLRVIQPGYIEMYAINAQTLRLHESFELLGDTEVWTAESKTGGYCLMLISATESYGTYTAGCVPHGIDSLLDVYVFEGMPEGLGLDLPVGSVIRFTYRGDDVNVWVAEAPEPRA